MHKKLINAVIPHLITKEKVSPITDPHLLNTIQELKQADSLETAMEAALQILSSRYQSKRLHTYLFFYKWYEKDVNKLWQRTGFMHCTHQNFLFRVLMIESGWLNDEQIQFGFSLIWFVSPHQFLRVSLPTGEVAIDPWNYRSGVPLGKYAAGFGSKTI